MKRVVASVLTAFCAASLFGWKPPPTGTKENPSPTDGRRSWSAVTAEVARVIKLCGKNEEGFYNDMGVLDLNGTLTAEEERTQIAVWSAMSSPMLTVGDASKWRESSRKLLEDLDFRNVNQDIVGRQAYPVLRKDGAMVLLKDCWGLNCRNKVVTFYNPTDKEVVLTLPFRDAELGGKVRVVDVMDKTPERNLTGSITEKVPPHGAKLFRCFGEKALMRNLYDIDSALQGVQGGDVQFRHVYAPTTGEYLLKVDAAPNVVYDVQVNGLFVKKGCRGAAELKIPLFLSENFVRFVSPDGRVPEIKAIRVGE